MSGSVLLVTRSSASYAVLQVCWLGVPPEALPSGSTVKTATDKNGNLTTSTYDGAGRLATVAQKPDPSGQPSLTYTTTITRDNNGNATSVTQANGVVTDYAFDALNRLTSVTTHPASGTNLVTSYALYGNGNTVTRTTADSVATTYTYDNLSRLTQISATGLSSIGYAYDELGRRTSMTDGTGTTTYTYDQMGRLTQAAQPNGTVGYGYDRDSDRTSLTYPGSNTVTYTYSYSGRLSSLQDWGSRTTSYTYTPSGLAATVTLPNGLVTSYTYDRAQRLTSLTNVGGSTTITSHTYTFDAEGNRTAQTEFVSGITTGASDSFGYTYDGLNRLTAVTTTNAESFTLDSASNIASRTGPSATFTYDTSNRLTSDGSSTFTWSNADRLTVRGSDSFGYDPLDRLTSSTVSGTSRTYAYNGDGPLQSRTQGATTNFLWDPATSPSRLLQVGTDKIVYGLGPLYVVTGSGTTTFARDGGKSVRAELNGSGSVAASFRYRAYGAIAQSNGASTPTYLGYAGQLLDPSGLYYMRARWFDPVSARFLSRDPISGDPQNPATLSAFGYAAANPVLFRDPSGMCFPFCVVVAVGAIVGGISGWAAYQIGCGSNCTVAGAAGATAAGAVTGALIGLSGPIAGTVGRAAVQLGLRLAAKGAATFAAAALWRAGSGAAGYVAGGLVRNAANAERREPDFDFDLGQATIAGVGAAVVGGALDALFPMRGVNSLSQYMFAPQDFLSAGPNGEALWNGALAGAAVGVIESIVQSGRPR